MWFIFNRFITCCMFTGLLAQSAVMTGIQCFKKMNEISSYLYRRCGVSQFQGKVLRHMIGGDGYQAIEGLAAMMALPATQGAPLRCRGG